MTNSLGAALGFARSRSGAFSPPSTMVCIRMEDQSQSLGSHPRLSAGVGSNGRFAVLEEDRDEEVMFEVRACWRRVAASPSFPPTAVDLVRSTEVGMASASEVGVPEAETESIFSAVPEGEVGSDEEVEVESEADVAPVAMIRRSAHIQEGFISSDMVNVREVITIRRCDEGASNIPPRCIEVCHEVGFARDRQWHGAPKPFAHSERLEIVHIDPENVVVPTGTRRQSSEKPVVGQVTIERETEQGGRCGEEG